MTDMQVFFFLLSSCLLLKKTNEFRISEVPRSQHSYDPKSTQVGLDSANEEEISEIDFQSLRKEEPPKLPLSLLDALAQPIPPTLDLVPHDVFPYWAETVESIRSGEVAAEQIPDHSLNSRSSDVKLVLAPKDTVRSSHELKTEMEINNRNQDVHGSLQNADTSIKSSNQGNVGITDTTMCTKCQQNVSPNQNCQCCNKCPNGPCPSCSSKCRKCSCHPPPEKVVPPRARGCCADCKARCLQKIARCVELAMSLGEGVAASASRALERIEALAAKYAVDKS